MSEALYGYGGLRFWSEEEIEQREAFVKRAAWVVRDELTKINPAWQFRRVEGPLLIPSYRVNEAYTEEDIFITNHTAGSARGTYSWCLRPETTNSSYTLARHLMETDPKRCKLPLCVWQVGKSFRRELNDGATAAKLRFNEFYQLEFQCIYSVGTKADYREPVMQAIGAEIQRAVQRPWQIVDSDRLPSYSESTKDIEVSINRGAPIHVGGREVASCSIRKDFSDDTRVFELAIGLDRVVELIK